MRQNNIWKLFQSLSGLKNYLKALLSICFVGLLFASNQARATITITGVEGAYSGSSIATGGTSVTIYQSLVNPGTTCTAPDDSTPCNNCTTAIAGNVGTAACATRYVADSQFVTIVFTSTAAGTLSVKTSTDLALDLNGSATAVAANTPHRVKLKWDDIDDYFTSGTVALKLLVDTTSVTMTFKEVTTLGNDSDCTSNVYGACDFRTFPGDEKSYLELDIATDYPSNSGTADFSGVRVFYQEITSGQVAQCPSRTTTTVGCGVTFTYEASQSVDIAIDTDRSFDDTITGLENDKYYCFQIVNMDVANNLGYSISTSSTDTTNKCLSSSPSEVVGLLTKTQNCFIATAAFGSAMHPKVKTFRQLRDQFLLPTKLGRKFVKWYYATSPKWAEKIEKNETAKFAVRLALWPLWLLSLLVLNVSPFVLLGFLILGLFAIVYRMKKNTATLGALLLLLLPLQALQAQELDPNSEDDAPPQEAPFLSPEDEVLEDVQDETVQAEPPKPAPQAPPVAQPQPTRTAQQSDRQVEARIQTLKQNIEVEQSNIHQDNAKIIKLESELKNLEDVQRRRRLNIGSKQKQILDLELQERIKRDPPKLTKKTGEIFYPRKESAQTYGGAFRVGQYSPTRLQNPDTRIYFDDVYDESADLIFYFDFEYQFFKSLGKLGIKIGSGVFTATGAGKFKNTQEEAREKFTFVMFPNTVGGVYRLQLWDKQPLVPFVEGGAGYFTFVEVRDDFKRTKYGGSPVGYWAAGGSLLLDYFSPATMGELDTDYGINHMWLTAEYRSFIGGGDLDFTADSWNAGILFEF